ncbi:MAG: hypothetical protein GY824_07555, partial [Delftia sp.]|nr:hypothetical protein [Delftia sp.]
EHWAEHYATQSKLTALIQAVETSVEAGTHFTREELALRAALEEAKR